MQPKKPEITRTEQALHVAMGNGAEIDFALDGERLMGIREVRQAGVSMRNPQKLWRPFLYTPEGIHYTEFRLKAARVTKQGAVRVETEAIGTRTLRKEEDDEYLCDVLELTAEDGPVTDSLTWILQPGELELDGQTFTGFSYVYRFRSSDPARKIYRIFDSASWEIGGHVAGNTLLCQGQVNPPVTELTQDGYFTTACNYYESQMGAVMGPGKKVSMQRLSRIGTLQAFDFMAHAQGVLFNYFDPLIDVVSILQKDKGEDILHVVDELRRPLSDRLESHPKHVLFLATAKPLAREACRDLWCRALDFVHDHERARHKIRRSHVLPRVWTPQVAQEQYRFGRDRGPRDRALYYLADNVLPRWADMGVKEICAPSYWVCDYTVDRFKCKNDTGLQGGLTVSGICCVRVHEIDQLWGGADAVAYMVSAAHRLGMSVQLWWASHLSRRAPIFAERPDFMIRSREGQPGCAGIGHETIIPMDLNNPDCFEWEYGKLKRVYEATGVDGFFHDSYGNYTFLPVNYNDPLRRAQQEAYGRLLSRLQKLGMNSMTVEGLGPWGVGHFGMGLVPSTPGKPVRYQNALDWWLGQEDMVYGLNMGIHSGPWPGREEDAHHFAFRCMAHGGRFGFTQHRHGLEMWSGWIRDLNRLHARIAPLSGRRTLLPEDRGVLWDIPGGERILFSFEAFDFDTGEAGDISEVTADGEPSAAAGGRLRTSPYRVYRLA